MLRGDVSHADVTLALHRDEANGRAYVGVMIGDAFVPFFEQKLSLFDDLLRAAQAEESKANEAKAAADAPSSSTSPGQ